LPHGYQFPLDLVPVRSYHAYHEIAKTSSEVFCFCGGTTYNNASTAYFLFC
jgi:hypothetical protein